MSPPHHPSLPPSLSSPPLSPAAISPDASIPAVEMCWLMSEAGIMSSAMDTL